MLPIYVLGNTHTLIFMALTHEADIISARQSLFLVGLDPDQIDEYKRLHADGNPGVRDLLSKYHMENFSIYLHQMPDGKWYEFGYYEYTGDDFEGDMKTMDAEPRTEEWLKQCDPMQRPLPGSKSWTEMERVYFNQ